jgi:hypothetical protein
MASEEIRSQIEAEVRRRLETHFSQLADEFERLRAESDRRWESFVARFQDRPAELVPAHLIPEPPPPPPPAVETPVPELDYREARKLVKMIDGAANQVETLKFFLEACIQKADRVVLLVSKGENFTVWKSDGFGEEEEAKLRSVVLAPGEHAAVKAALEGVPVALPAGTGVARALLSEDAWNGVLVPISVREKISALLYADRRREDSTFDPDALSLFAYVVGVAVDRLATRKLHPAPALKSALKWEEEPPKPAPPPPPPRVEPPPPPPRVEPPKPPPPREAEPSVSDFRTQMFATSDIASATSSPAPPVMPTPPPAPRVMPTPPPALPPPARKPEGEGIGAGTGKAFIPPAGVQPGGARILRGPLASGAEDPHEQARKIARLLVSDIKLYNEAAIAEGKKNNDIYARLRDDIDRSRQTYNERVPETVRTRVDYFQEELVRSLADGRAESLGMPETPGF